MSRRSSAALPTAQGLPRAAAASTGPGPSPVEPRHPSFNQPITPREPSPSPLQDTGKRSSKAAPADAVMPDNGKNSCPRGHPLIRVAVSVAGLECDVCGANVPAGDATYSCEPCDYDACRRCTEQAAEAAEESRTEGAVEGRKRQARPSAGAAVGSAGSAGAATGAAADAAADSGRLVKAARLGAGQARRVAAPTGLALALCPAVARGEAEALRAAAHALGGVKVYA